MVLFSSKPAMRRDVFDYVTFVEDMPHTKLFLRDATTDYLYHNGIEGLTKDIDETVAFLKLFLKRMKPSRITFMGMSGGAYAATLFGHLVGADPDITVDDIHLQSAVSFVDPEMRDKLGGGERFPGMFQNLIDFLDARGEKPRFLNLADVIRDNPGAVKVMRMYYAEGDEIDTLQAQNLAEFPHVQVVSHPSRSHMMLGSLIMRQGTLYRDIDTDVETLMSETPSSDPVESYMPMPFGIRSQQAAQAG